MHNPSALWRGIHYGQKNPVITPTHNIVYFALVHDSAVTAICDSWGWKTKGREFPSSSKSPHLMATSVTHPQTLGDCRGLGSGKQLQAWSKPPKSKRPRLQGDPSEPSSGSICCKLAICLTHQLIQNAGSELLSFWGAKNLDPNIVVLQEMKGDFQISKSCSRELFGKSLSHSTLPQLLLFPLLDPVFTLKVQWVCSKDQSWSYTVILLGLKPT